MTQLPQREANTMDEQVYWILECDIRPGEMKSLLGVMNDLVEATRANEPGTLNYEWSLSADGRRCYLFERFADSAAAVTHLATFGKHFAKRFDAALQATRMVVYGDADDQVKSALSGLGAEYMKPLGGFSR